MTKKRKKKQRGGDKTEDAAATAAEAAMDAVQPEGEAAVESPDAPEGEPEVDAASSEVKEADEASDEESPLAQALRERDEYLELARKTRAELENYRRRVVRDREADKQRYQADLLRELLTPLDDFERALAHAEEEKNFDTLYEGLTMVRDAIWKAIGTTGFEKIPGEPGTSFDPNVHEAMMQIPHPEHPQNAIVDEIASGYKLGEMVLRASKVVVSAGTPGEEAPAKEADTEGKEGEEEA
ncbi:MAG: nucleotide exchange factor GrpE [Planctomycetota bacterium]|jgi:molecular chaperone GrpE